MEDNYLSVWNNQEHIPKMDETIREEYKYIGEHLLLWEMGKGEFGEVNACRYKNNDKDYVIKSVDKDRLLKNKDARRAIRAIKRVNTEIEALVCLSPHTNINGLMEVIHGRRYINYVLERASTDLYDFYKDAAPESEVYYIMKELVSGLKHCHEHNVAHRDIKPENVLVNGKNMMRSRVMLCDFGLCAIYDETKLLGDFVGSPGFFAPELMKCGLYDGEKIDVWSLGVLCLELILGHEIFHTSWVLCYRNKVFKEDGSTFDRFLGKKVKELSVVMRSVITRQNIMRAVMACLEIDSNKRERVDVLKKYLENDRDIRIKKPNISLQMDDVEKASDNNIESALTCSNKKLCRRYKEDQELTPNGKKINIDMFAGNENEINI